MLGTTEVAQAETDRVALAALKQYLARQSEMSGLFKLSWPLLRRVLGLPRTATKEEMVALLSQVQGFAQLRSYDDLTVTFNLIRTGFGEVHPLYKKAA